MVNYMEFQDWMFDKRVFKRNIRRGIIAREDYKKFVAGLPDVTDQIADPSEDEDLFADPSEKSEEETPEQEAPAPAVEEEPEQEA
jgi:hypothetical protein